jgi:hypothetical protein
MDSGGTRGLRRLEEVSDYPTHPSGLETPQKLTALHIGYKQRGQYSNRHWMGGVRHQSQDPVPYLFQQWSAEWLQDLVLSYHEAHLSTANHISQAIPLFSGTPDRGPHFIDSRWDTKQQGGNWENYQMGHWAVHIRHCLQAKDSDQGSSFKWLHGRVDRDSDTS